MRVEMETPNQPWLNTNGLAISSFIKVCKDDFHLHVKLHQKKIKPWKLGGDGGTHSSNLWTLLEGNFISADFPRGHPGSHISQPTQWISKEEAPRLWIPSPKSVIIRPLRDPGIFSKSRSWDSQKSNPWNCRDFQKPLNDSILRLSTPFIDHNSLFWDLWSLQEGQKSF